MGIITQVVAATEDEVEALGESLHPLDEWPGVECRDIDIPRLAMLHALLTGDLFDDAVTLYEPIYISAAEGSFVLHVSGELRDCLARLDEEALEAVAAELCATEVFESEDAQPAWDSEQAEQWLAQLADLAVRAQTEGLPLFAWLHPSGR